MKRSWRIIAVFAVSGIAVVVILTAMTAYTAANTVPVTRADKDSMGVGVNEVQPPQCVGLGLTNIVDIGAGETGTGANDLILGTPSGDPVIRGGAGNDCILAGGGNDRRFFFFLPIPGLFGEDGDDVLIGGPGLDVCFGGAGSDTYYECEITY